MSQPTREEIFAALYALAQTITWPDGGAFLYTSRRVKLWDDLPNQPALCQAEHDEQAAQTTNMAARRTFNVAWLIYHKAGADPDAIPATTTNAILDAVEAALAPQPPTPAMPNPGWLDGRNTLGGLVHHCWINGKVFKEQGDIDGQALIVVPLSILVP